MSPSNDELIAEMQRLNANLEALLSTSQGELLARLVEILSDLRQSGGKRIGVHNTPRSPIMTQDPHPIPITGEEIDSICEALRYMASDMCGVGSVHRQREVNALRRLAEQVEARFAVAAAQAAGVEMLTGDED